MSQINFDASTIEPQKPLEPVKPGWYIAQIVESDMRTNKQGTGSYLALTFQILEGEGKGRKIFTNLNIHNQSELAVRIAQEQLSAICHATGVIQVQDSVQLHTIPLMIKVGVRAGDGQYNDQNDIRGYKPTEDKAKATGATATAGAPAWANKSATAPAAQYKVGDVVNGHQFDGTKWNPVATTSPTPTPPNSAVPPPGVPEPAASSAVPPWLRPSGT